MGRISTSPRRAVDEHLLDIAALEVRFRTSLTTGLSTAYVTEFQASPSYAANLLPTDAETGHGAIHELVGVLRDGNWIHTRAENLVPGDVVSVKAGQCVPADIRLVDAADLWVNHETLTGETAPLERLATTISVFDSPGMLNLPYMQAANMVFYGTTVTQGTGKGIVCRTGAETVLGVISGTVLHQDGARPLAAPDAKLLDDVRALGVACKHETALPSALAKVSAMVVSAPAVLQRTIATVAFGTSPPTLVTPTTVGLHDDAASSTDALEAALASYMATTFTAPEAHHDAQAMMRALAACRHFPDDLSRDQAAIARFCDLFHDPSTSRYSASLAGHVSGCEVYVHFDQECSAHIVVLHGPAREVLSRCGHVRKGVSPTATPTAVLDTHDLQHVEAMLEALEAMGQLVVGVAELYLDPQAFPVGTTFDIDALNFPTSNMVYLGALGLVDKPQPELVALAAHCQAADVNLYVVTEHSEFAKEAARRPPPVTEDDPQAKARAVSVDDADVMSPEMESTHSFALASPRQLSTAGRFAPLCRVQLSVEDSASRKPYTLSPKVVDASAISIANTFTEWKLLLLEHPCVIIEAGTPAQIDLLVETLQDLGETVGLVASGNANALSLMNADVGFAVPTGNTIDLSEDAADFVLGYGDQPRVDAVRMVELAKRVPTDVPDPKPPVAAPTCDDSATQEAKQVLQNLFRDAVAVGRLLHLSDEAIHDCFDVAIGRAPKPFAVNAFMTSMLTSMAALKP